MIPARTHHIRFALVLIAFNLLLNSFVAFAATNQEATPVRTADASCARCHAAIFKSYLETPMANASGSANDNLRDGKFEHAASSMEYTIAAHQDRPTLSYRSLTDPDLAGHFPLEYFLGSGHLGTTYLYLQGNFLFESPVAWYGPTRSFDMKPGLQEMTSMPPPIPMESGCLRCHMSSVQAAAPGTINRYQGLAFLHTGITCESCHGDSDAHVRSDGKAGVVNPKKLTAEQRDSVCINCHLEGDVLVQRAGLSPLDYRPGESISKYLAFYVRTKANLTQRGVSEVEQLAQSTCKRMSGDRMSCTSCHDPHYTPAAAEKAAFFRGKCLACHSQPEFAQTHHPENKDCTSCHMSRTGAENIPHVAWTDHRILKLPEASNSKTVLESSSGDLTPIFSPTADARDLAMANYKALLLGDKSREPVAWEQLNALSKTGNVDAATLDALGTLAAERKNAQTAEEEFRRALAFAPDDLTALSDLGVLLAREGKLNESVAMLQKAFAKNQDLPGLSMNLARVECIAGDAEGARATLNATLAYGSNLESVRRLLGQLTSCKSLGTR
ncbi:MAG: hypothetical protein JST28_21585 [Acidobacteria bacterium]|nr:hypothetical protein [Acidobacteriota bacterium]